jgi:chromosome segregation ATPase
LQLKSINKQYTSTLTTYLGVFMSAIPPSSSAYSASLALSDHKNTTYTFEQEPANVANNTTDNDTALRAFQAQRHQLDHLETRKDYLQRELGGVQKELLKLEEIVKPQHPEYLQTLQQRCALQEQELLQLKELREKTTAELVTVQGKIDGAKEKLKHPGKPQRQAAQKTLSLLIQQKSGLQDKQQQLQLKIDELEKKSLSANFKKTELEDALSQRHYLQTRQKELESAIAQIDNDICRQLPRLIQQSRTVAPAAATSSLPKEFYDDVRGLKSRSDELAEFREELSLLNEELEQLDKQPRSNGQSQACAEARKKISWVQKKITFHSQFFEQHLQTFFSTYEPKYGEEWLRSYLESRSIICDCSSCHDS